MWVVSLGAEGVPYEFESFTTMGVLDAEASTLLDNDQAWQPKADEKPVVHRKELPVDNAVVAFH